MIPLNTAAVDLPDASKIDRAELEQAFSLFNEASRQLVESYQELEQKVSSLTHELALANGALRQEFEQKVALSDRLEALLAALPAGVVELDANGVVTTCNPAASEIFAMPLLGLAWEVQIAPVLVATAVMDERHYVTAAGAEKRLGMASRQLPSGETILLIHDLSESWRLSRQLEHHKRLASMGEMAAGLAHQLRTPLATALLYTANLARPVLAESDRIKFGEKSLARLRHLESLIQNMLQFVRGQQSGREQVNLRQVIEEAMQTVQPQDAAMQRRWSSVLSRDEAWVQASRKELLGAIINLLENAVQATTIGGHISLRLDKRPAHWRVTVSDDGCGMSDEVKERLFEPFFTTRKEGTGLGLAIVRNLMANYNGEVLLESVLGEGSTFTLIFPFLS